MTSLIWLGLGVIAVPLIVAVFQASRNWSQRDPEEQRKNIDKYTK